MLKKSFRASSVGIILTVGINRAHQDGHVQKSLTHGNVYSKSYNRKTEFASMAAYKYRLILRATKRIHIGLVTGSTYTFIVDGIFFALCRCVLKYTVIVMGRTKKGCRNYIIFSTGR